ncbi:MAG TPA: IS1380 family transposase [Steroidobacteraceae bacterium]|nr:IS1380 family transposase [Steroidobacteraceae bacterium]
MGEESTSVRFDFNGSVRVAARGEQLSGNAGAMLLRAVDDAVGVTKQIARDLHDPRNPELTRYGMTELLRTRLQMIALGYRDQGDSDLLRRDPVLRLAVSDAAGLSPLGDTSLASQPTMSRLIDTLAIPSNLARMNKGLLDGAIRCGHQGRGLDRRRATIDVDSFPIEAHGHQPGSEWNRHYGMRCFHPLIAMLDTGHWLGVELRPGNAHTAAGIVDFLQPILDGVARATGEKPRVRGDSGFVSPGTLDALEAQGVEYVFRINNNAALDRLAKPFLVRPEGRRPKEPREWVHDIEYQTGSWDKLRRAVIVVMERKDELYLHHFVLVTNALRRDWPAARLLEDYRQRGTMEGRIGEMQSVLAPALSCTQRGEDRSTRDPGEVEFRNAATLALFALAYNLAHSARLVHVRATRQPCALDRLRKKLLAVPALVVVSARRATLAVNSTVAEAWARFLRTLAVPKVA